MKHTCIMCGQLMMLEKKFNNVPRKYSTGSYKVQRFHCSFCEFSELLTANGERDIQQEEVLEDVKQMYKQEEENRL